MARVAQAHADKVAARAAADGARAQVIEQREQAIAAKARAKAEETARRKADRDRNREAKLIESRLYQAGYYQETTKAKRMNAEPAMPLHPLITPEIAAMLTRPVAVRTIRVTAAD